MHLHIWPFISAYYVFLNSPVERILFLYAFQGEKSVYEMQVAMCSNQANFIV